MYDIEKEIVWDLVKEVEHLKQRCDIASERIEELEKRFKLAGIQHMFIPNNTDRNFDGLQV